MSQEKPNPNQIDVSKFLTLGTFEPKHSPYSEERIYGFNPSEAKSILAFAQGQPVDVELFLAMTERARKILEFSDHGFRTDQSFPLKKYHWVIFPFFDQEKLPELKAIEETLCQALSKLFPRIFDEFMTQELDVDPIIRNHGLNELLTKTQEQLQALNDPRLIQSYLNTAIAFVDFLQGEGLEVLKRPTQERWFHEVFDPKLK